MNEFNNEVFLDALEKHTTWTRASQQVITSALVNQVLEAVGSPMRVVPYDLAKPAIEEIVKRMKATTPSSDPSPSPALT